MQQDCDRPIDRPGNETMLLLRPGDLGRFAYPPSAPKGGTDLSQRAGRGLSPDEVLEVLEVENFSRRLEVEALLSSQLL